MNENNDGNGLIGVIVMCLSIYCVYLNGQIKDNLSKISDLQSSVSYYQSQIATMKQSALDAQNSSYEEAQDALSEIETQE